MAKYDFEEIEQLLKKHANDSFKDKWIIIGLTYDANPETVRKWHYRQKKKVNGKQVTKPPIIPIQPITSGDIIRKSSALWRSIFFLVTGKASKGRIRDIIRTLITYLEEYLVNIDSLDYREGQKPK